MALPVMPVAPVTIAVAMLVFNWICVLDCNPFDVFKLLQLFQGPFQGGSCLYLMVFGKGCQVLMLRYKVV